MKRQTNLETCLVIVTGLLIIFLFKDWRPVLVAAIIIGLVGVFLNKQASWITWLWNKIGDFIGKVVPKVLLAVVFYVFLIPLSVLSRIFRKDRLGLKKRSRDSMWIDREYPFSKEDLLKPW
jgi:hypothetical protein